MNSSAQPALAAANEALAEMRLSFDDSPGTRSPSPGRVNGYYAKPTENGYSAPRNGAHSDEPEVDMVDRLREELERTKRENETLTTKYNNLVAKLTAMRTSVESKLKSDAEELDRREQLVQQLTAQNEDLASTVETLKEELIISNAEADRSSRELESMRNRAFEDSAHETALRERELRDLQSELERCRIERDEWERAVLEERVVLDEAKAALSSVQRELELEKEIKARDAESLQREREMNANLQSVLEDFQTAKEHETRQAVREYEDRLNEATQSLAQFKSRALKAEVELQESSSNSQRTTQLEQQLKEKNLLIGKLRHEAVILNEHLTEAIRRLRNGASDNNVDRRLVSNVIISFLNTPRSDSKRFEMLSLLATILSWSDSEREKAGLQRTSGSATSLLSRSSNKGKSLEQEKIDETESFSKMWVEFLLKEAAQGTAPPSPGAATTPPSFGRKSSLPNSPVHPPGSPFGKSARLPSFHSTTSVESSRQIPPRSDSVNDVRPS